MPKIFVLDTNVLLHDYRSLYKFQDNDIVIPLVDLEEIDHFKKGNDQINFNAREIMRSLDKLAGKGLFEEGIQLGRNMGKLSVVIGKGLTQAMKEAAMEDIPDHRILAVALDLQEEHPERYVCLVSKDINLRMKAQAFGVPAQDYLNDKAPDEEELNKRRVGVVRVPDSVIAELYERPEGINPKEMKVKPVSNEYFEIGGSGAHIPVFYNPHTRSVVKVESRNVSGISPRNQEQACALDALMRPDIQLVALTGVAGTGKTLLALAAALAQMDSYKSILLSRPVIPLETGALYVASLRQSGGHQEQDPHFVQGILPDRRNAEKRGFPDYAFGLYPRAQSFGHLLYRGRGAEPDPARSQDHYHAGRGRHQDGLYRRPASDRLALSGFPFQRAQLSLRSDVRGRAVRDGEFGEGGEECVG